MVTYGTTVAQDNHKSFMQKEVAKLCNEALDLIEDAMSFIDHSRTTTAVRKELRAEQLRQTIEGVLQRNNLLAAIYTLQEAKEFYEYGY